MNNTIDRIKREGSIKALKEEIDTLIMMLRYGCWENYNKCRWEGLGDYYSELNKSLYCVEGFVDDIKEMLSALEGLEKVE